MLYFITSVHCSLYWKTVFREENHLVCSLNWAGYTRSVKTASLTTCASWLQQHLGASFWGRGRLPAQEDVELGDGVSWTQHPFSKHPSWESRSWVPGSGWREME